AAREADVSPCARPRVRGSGEAARRDSGASADRPRSRYRGGRVSAAPCSATRRARDFHRRYGEGLESSPPKWVSLRLRQARSSVVEHHLDMVGVGGSIPLAPTRIPEDAAASSG